jgi:hypothetical protein
MLISENKLARSRRATGWWSAVVEELLVDSWSGAVGTRNAWERQLILFSWLLMFSSETALN